MKPVHVMPSPELCHACTAHPLAGSHVLVPWSTSSLHPFPLKSFVCTHNSPHAVEKEEIKTCITRKHSCYPSNKWRGHPFVCFARDECPEWRITSPRMCRLLIEKGPLPQSHGVRRITDAAAHTWRRTHRVAHLWATPVNTTYEVLYPPPI